MQLVATVALVASAFLLQQSEAAPNGHVHLRVAAAGASKKAPGEWEQCKWQSKKVDCAKGFTCMVQNDYYGQCIKSPADLWGQCGGYGWTGSCVSGATCQKKDDHYSQCVPASTSTAANGEQCQFETYTKPCGSNLVCINESAYYGYCRPNGNVALGDQCGWPLYSTTCKEGTCVMKSNHYSVCEK